MKKQLILSMLVVFCIAVFAPAIVNAMGSTTVIVNVEGDDKKVEKKADTPKAGCAEATKAGCAGTAKAGCTEAKKADCSATPKAACCSDAKKTETKASCSEKKVESTGTKPAEVK